MERDGREQPPEPALIEHWIACYGSGPAAAAWLRQLADHLDPPDSPDSLRPDRGGWLSGPCLGGPPAGAR